MVIVVGQDSCPYICVFGTSVGHCLLYAQSDIQYDVMNDWRFPVASLDMFWILCTCFGLWNMTTTVFIEGW